MRRTSVGFIELASALFPSGELGRLLIVLATAITVAIFEAIGVASIVPFMAVALDPSTLERYPWFAPIAERFGVTDLRGQLMLLGVATAGAMVASNTASAVGLYVQQRFVARTRVRLTTALFDAYLAQPYSFHTRRDSSSLMSVIFGDAENVTRLVAAGIQLVARVLVIVALLSLLLLQNPQVAQWTLGGLGGAYFIIYGLIRRYQSRLGELISEAVGRRHRALQEGLGGVKDLIVLGRERQKLEDFHRATVDVAYAQIGNAVTAGLPKFLLEPIAFGGIIAIALLLISRGEASASSAIPTLALYAFVGYRLMPALQQVFAAAVEIRFTTPSLRALHADWKLVRATPRSETEVEEVGALALAARHATLRLSDVSFAYPDNPKLALDRVSMEVAAGESIGLVGKTGSGKTTLADLLLGLYTPNSGTVSIGDVVLGPRTVRAWRRHIGYVPQQVFLSNSSILENIAFGLSVDDIDRASVERVARVAHAHEFIEQLPDAYDTVVGERGVRLSGGQRQRLGIARALYNDPEILIFDEATSALDGMTEDAVMAAIHSLRGSRTVILIAHRLRTVEACDRIIRLEHGSVVESGTYNELLRDSDAFRRMVGRSAEQTVSTHASNGALDVVGS